MGSTKREEWVTSAVAGRGRPSIKLGLGIGGGGAEGQAVAGVQCRIKGLLRHNAPPIAAVEPRQLLRLPQA